MDYLCLSFRRGEIQNFVSSPDSSLNTHAVTREGNVNKIIAMDTETRKVSLVGTRPFNNHVEHGHQTNATLLFTPREQKKC